MRPQAVSAAFLLLLLAAAGAQATTFVMVRDEALADQAALVVEARLLSHGPAAGAGGAPATEYVFAVERVVKGVAAQDRVVVRVPGGVTADGSRGLAIWGAPRFRDGERALLFLNPGRAAGVHRVLHLALGAFHVADAAGGPVALRELSAMHEARPGPGGPSVAPAGADRPRDLARFTRWVADREAGRRRAADYFVELPEPELRRLTESFTLFECPFIPQAPDCEGLNFRWFEFDDGGGVSFRAHNDGQQGVSGGGFNQFQTALNAWNNDAATQINYVYGGKTAAATGFDDGPDGINAILFNDKNGDSSFDAPFDCDTGGVLAVGGPWFDPNDRGTFDGKTFVPIAEADILTNANLGCFFAGSEAPGKAAEELFGHELGHTLGLGHSCGDGGSGACNTPAKTDALMRAFIHDDGRGASLRIDDRAGIGELYAEGSSGPPAAPTNLGAAGLSTTQVGLTWQDNATNETAFAIEVKLLSGGAFLEIGTVGANSAAATVTGLTPATVYDFRVRARNAAGNSAYSNPAAASTFGPAAPCAASGETLCLNGNRFAVRSFFESGAGNGTAQVVELTPDTGYFWFFASSNVEAVLKVLNACSFNNRFWVFAGGLTDVRTIITVTDSQNGTTRTYENPQGTPFQPVQDTSAFATCP